MLLGANKITIYSEKSYPKLKKKKNTKKTKKQNNEKQKTKRTTKLKKNIKTMGTNINAVLRYY